MSTNASIGVVVNGKIKGVYLHWDGYLEGAGSMLLNHYGDQAKAEEIVSLGGLSVLGPDIGVKHPFDTTWLTDKEKEKYAGMTTAYGRDRGEIGQEAKTFDTAEEFVDYFTGDYSYLLGTDGVWYYCTYEHPNTWKRIPE